MVQDLRKGLDVVLREFTVDVKQAYPSNKQQLAQALSALLSGKTIV